MEYVNTLSKFGTKVADRNQRVKYPKIPTRFRVLFEGFAAPIGGEDITMDMKTFTAPKGQFEEKQIDCVNGPIYYAGGWTWEPSDFTVYDSYDNANYKSLYRQIQLQRDLSEQVTATVSQNYKYVSKYECTDGHQNTICTWVMEGCFLTKAQVADGEAGNYDAQVISCSQRFDNAVLYDFDGTLITGDGAISTMMSKVMAF